MSGLKKTIEPLTVLAWFALSLSIGVTIYAYNKAPAPNKEPFVPMELACVDSEGKPVVRETALRYFRDGGTIVGYDGKGTFYVYTPPLGWMCRFGETKK
jgi:hypothetical protein